MSVPTSHRRKPRLTRFQKVTAVTGVAAVGATALAVGVSANGEEGEIATAGSDIQAQPVAWQAAVDAPAAQKASLDAQTTHADLRAQEEAQQAEKAAAAKKAAEEKKAEAKKKAEAERRAEAARKEARAEKKRKAEQAVREKAAKERSEQQSASRSATRSAQPSGSPQQIAQQIIGDQQQFQCFSNIVERESGWNVHAQNPSGAYGLVQALPGSKMASAGPDWQNNAATQIKWGLGYMNDRYGSPCGAWSFWQANNWY